MYLICEEIESRKPKKYVVKSGLLKTIVLVLVSARKEGLKTASQGRIRITKQCSNF
jgi:hypothetical protein